MKHSNVSIFVTHVGCPHMCAFCNQRTITGNTEIPHANDVKRICTQALEQVKDRHNTQIAFFGGSFTAVSRDYMIELLEAANEFIGEDGFCGIRISTRPDYIDEQVLEILKQYNVTAIELGAQSLCDDVLEANERGHTAADVENASKLIKDAGFELGLQMMVGLYKSSYEREINTMNKIISLQPETVRIYPVVVLEGTKLAQLYKNGEYRLMPFDIVVGLCARMLCSFRLAGINVIKLGLHASELVESNIVAGYYHPAFSEIVYSNVFFDCIQRFVCRTGSKELNICVNSRSYSKTVGHKKRNITALESDGINCTIIIDDKIDRFDIIINGEIVNVFEITGNTRL